MKGKSTIIATLNGLLADELAARDQYLAHSHMLQHWGYGKLAERIAHEADDEKNHCSVLIQRILFLEGQPSMTPSPLTIGGSVPEILKNDLAVELQVRANLNRAIAQCDAELDSGTRDALLPLLHETEMDHIDWLEKQLHAIAEIGLPLYLQRQASPA